jgi:phosphotransferase system enzyme I (PtsI)
MFLTQLRAILRASHYGTVRILLPMVAHAHEIDQTLALIQQAKSQLEERGQPYDRAIQVGGMIEIPAAALAMGAFVRKLDFLSIGTNDLIQYTLAVDRSDDAVSHLYDPLHPAVLRLIALAIGNATKANVPIAVCGEMAGDLLLTRLLLGLGLREFSMHPSHLLGVKQRVLQTDVSATEPLIERMRRIDEPDKLAALLARLNA